MCQLYLEDGDTGCGSQSIGSAVHIQPIRVAAGSCQTMRSKRIDFTQMLNCLISWLYQNVWSCTWGRRCRFQIQSCRDAKQQPSPVSPLTTLSAAASTRHCSPVVASLCLHWAIKPSEVILRDLWVWDIWPKFIRNLEVTGDSICNSCDVWNIVTHRGTLLLCRPNRGVKPHHVTNLPR